LLIGLHVPNNTALRTCFHAVLDRARCQHPNVANKDDYLSHMRRDSDEQQIFLQTIAKLTRSSKTKFRSEIRRGQSDTKTTVDILSTEVVRNHDRERPWRLNQRAHIEPRLPLGLGHRVLAPLNQQAQSSRDKVEDGQFSAKSKYQLLLQRSYWLFAIQIRLSETNPFSKNRFRSTAGNSLPSRRSTFLAVSARRRTCTKCAFQTGHDSNGLTSLTKACRRYRLALAASYV
jgi:hypothetical protein